MFAYAVVAMCKKPSFVFPACVMPLLPNATISF
jgi:hypothetical protein